MAQIPCGFGWSNIAKGMTVGTAYGKLPGSSGKQASSVSSRSAERVPCDHFTVMRIEFSIPFKLFSKVSLLIANRSYSHVSTGMAPFCIRLSLAPTSGFIVPSWESTNMVILARWYFSNKDPLSFCNLMVGSPSDVVHWSAASGGGVARRSFLDDGECGGSEYTAVVLL